MRVIGFNFSRISVEKLKKSTDNLKIKTEIDISDIKSIDPGILNTKEDILEAKFKYNVLYEPGFAKVELTGYVLFTLEPKLAKEVLNEWKKKKTPEGIRTALLNVIMRKAGPKAIALEDELNLPLHIPFPSLRPSDEQKK